MNSKLPPFQKISGKINFKKKSGSNIYIRTYIIPVVMLLVYLVFFIRLFHLTILKGNFYHVAAENNRIREVIIEPKRGTIYDRKGRTLAFSSQPESDKEHETETSQRTYNNGKIFAHLIGYRQLASEKDLKNDACPDRLVLNDKTGVEGVEELFECELRGTKGKKLIEVDTKGTFVKTLNILDPVAGKDIHLSIDAELQEKAYDVIVNNDITTSVEIDISKKKVAIVGLNPKTGEILILLSYPSFDPQVFEDANDDETKKYLKDKEKSLLNRALLGTYPPGSIFKPIVSVGALEEGVVGAKDTYKDVGFVKAGAVTFHNWYYTQYGRVEGLVDMERAITRSTDTYFYKIGEKLTPEKIKVWAEKFGLGKKIDIGLDHEEGIVPSAFWKKETINDRWYLGDTYNLSIGQGYLLTTPLHMALATAPFANGGKLCSPQLLKIDEDEAICTSLKLSKETLRVLRSGMKKACASGGTGWPFFNFNIHNSEITSETTAKTDYSDPLIRRLADRPSDFPISVGCKTGTAESHGFDTLPHAWFTVFAPFNDPEIVLTVMVEQGGEGSNVAAPIAKEILKTYFERTE